MKKLLIIAVAVSFFCAWPFGASAGPATESAPACAPETAGGENEAAEAVRSDAAGAEFTLYDEYSGSGQVFVKGPRSKRGRWSVGGSLGFGFGDHTSISVAPRIAYNWGGIVTLGGGVSYNYMRYKFYDTTYSINYFGGNVFARLYLFRNLFIFGQPEIYKRMDSVKDGPKEDRTFGCMLLGAGVSIPIGNRVSLDISAYYDVIQHEYSPHGNNIVGQVGFSFAL